MGTCDCRPSDRISLIKYTPLTHAGSVRNQNDTGHEHSTRPVAALAGGFTPAPTANGPPEATSLPNRPPEYPIRYSSHRAVVLKSARTCTETCSPCCTLVADG